MRIIVFSLMIIALAPRAQAQTPGTPSPVYQPHMQAVYDRWEALWDSAYAATPNQASVSLSSNDAFIDIPFTLTFSFTYDPEQEPAWPITERDARIAIWRAGTMVPGYHLVPIQDYTGPETDVLHFDVILEGTEYQYAIGGHFKPYDAPEEERCRGGSGSSATQPVMVPIEIFIKAQKTLNCYFRSRYLIKTHDIIERVHEKYRGR